MPNLPRGKVRQVRKNTRFLTYVPNLPNVAQTTMSVMVKASDRPFIRKLVVLLVGAGATVDREWLDNTEEGQKVRADASMLAALSGRTPQF